MLIYLFFLKFCELTSSFNIFTPDLLTLHRAVQCFIGGGGWLVFQIESEYQEVSVLKGSKLRI